MKQWVASMPPEVAERAGRMLADALRDRPDDDTEEREAS